MEQGGGGGGHWVELQRKPPHERRVVVSGAKGVPRAWEEGEATRVLGRELRHHGPLLVEQSEDSDASATLLK